MNKDLIEDKMYQLVDQFNQKKIFTKIFIQNCLIIYINFTMGTEKLVRFCLLAACFYNLNSIMKLGLLRLRLVKGFQNSLIS